MDTCGIIKTYYEDGNLKEEYFENNGKKEGIYKEYAKKLNEVDLDGNIINEEHIDRLKLEVKIFKREAFLIASASGCIFFFIQISSMLFKTSLHCVVSVLYK